MPSSADEPSAADQIADAGSAPPPGHPAAGTPPVPSPGEQLGRGADELAVPGDDVLLEGDDAGGAGPGGPAAPG